MDHCLPTGQLQFDLWGVQPKSGRWDWAQLKSRIAQHGLRNSLLVVAWCVIFLCFDTFGQFGSLEILRTIWDISVAYQKNVS